MEQPTSPSSEESNVTIPNTGDAVVFPGIARAIVQLDEIYQLPPIVIDGTENSPSPPPLPPFPAESGSSVNELEPQLPEQPLVGDLDFEALLAPSLNVDRLHEYLRLRFIGGVLEGGAAALAEIQMRDPAAALLDPSLDEDAYKYVLSEEGEKLLKRGLVGEGEHVVCCFAQTTLEPGTSTITLPCGHVFEAEPVEKWLREEKALCPMCRLKLPSREIRNESAFPLPVPSETSGSEAMETDEDEDTHEWGGAEQNQPDPPESFGARVAAMLVHAQHRAIEEEEMMLQAALLDIYSFTQDTD